MKKKRPLLLQQRHFNGVNGDNKERKHYSLLLQESIEETERPVNFERRGVQVVGKRDVLICRQIVSLKLLLRRNFFFFIGSFCLGV